MKNGFEASLTAQSLRCEYLSDPIGVGERSPRLSWKLLPTSAHETTRNLSQSAYQILAARSAVALERGIGDLWDSGKVASDQTVFVDYGGPALSSGQRVYWNVRVCDQAGQVSEPSATSFFEMGLLDRHEWKAQWIGSAISGGTHQEAPASMIRRSFAVEKRIASVRLYATALGLYEFYLNGGRISTDLFTPGWTDYRKRVQYQAYDVTDLLKFGENVIGAWLADGWYCGFTGNIDRRQFFGDRPQLFAQLLITFIDGSTQLIATDSTWTASTGPIISADLMMGQHYDARLEQPGWNSAGFEDARWSPVVVFPDTGIEIAATPGPTVREMEQIKPVSITHQGKNWERNKHLIDFGQNLVGHVRITIRNAKPGQPMRLRHAEVLDKLNTGALYTTNLRSAKQLDVFIPRGDAVETFDPQFTFHGFRFVEIDGYPTSDISPEDIVAVVVHSNYESTGTFECSDENVNQLQKNIRWGWRGNSIDVPTDCPQRNERLGWTGDAQAFIRTAAFNYDVSGFFAKWTQDLRDAQGEAGSYPPIVPDTSPADQPFGTPWHGDGGPAWADAGIICPWTTWLCYGDVRLVERHYPSMVKFLDYLNSTAAEFGGIRCHPNWKGWDGFGDWLSQDAGADHIKGLTPKDLIGTAFIVYDARLLAQIANALGKNADALRFEKIAADTTAAFQRRFVSPDGLVVGGTQTSYVLALHFDLLPEPSRATAVDWLAKDIERRGNKLATGFVGTPYLADVLTRFGRLDVAYKLLLQKDWPSWLFAVTHGATTIWERWDGWTPEKGFQNAGMNSFNHYAYGAIGAWLYERVAGIDIDPTGPGYRHIRFTPHPLKDGPLTHAKATVETVRGTVSSGWQIEANGKTVVYVFVVPPNTAATAQIRSSDPASVTEIYPAGSLIIIPDSASGGGSTFVNMKSGVYCLKAVL